MNFYIINRLWLTLLLLSVAAGGARAQWTKVAPNLVGPESQRIGAICVSHGVLWAGATALFSSTDTGKTWNQSSTFPVEEISDIAFYDSLTGLVGTYSGGAFLTQDGGQTWNIVIQPSGQPDCRVAFNGSASVMHDLNTDGTLSTSTDRGSTWKTQNFVNEGLTFAIGADKTIYVFTSGTSGWINNSTDLGKTWSGNGGGTDADSQGLAADSCDIHKLYLINENTRDRTNNTTKIEVSPDGGKTWQTNSSHQLDYYSGSIANTAQVAYVTTDAGGNGVLRSTDAGTSWKSIGGPMTNYDTRSIALVNNNIVLVLDSNGSVWRTKNSGGDSLTFPTELVLANDRMQIMGTACSPSDTGIVLHVQVQSCMPLSAELDSLWITGSGSFTRPCECPPMPLLLSGADSIPLRFWSSVSGSDTAELHLALTIGNVNLDTTIQLIGKSASASPANPSVTHRESASAYVGQFDSLTLGVDVSSDINLDSLWPYLTDVQATYTWDSSVVSYASYLPPIGWSVTSATPRGNAADIAIHNVSSSASSPLDLGTAIFKPNQNQLATSWVGLPRLGLFAGGQNLGFCVTDNEDHHWAVQTLGASSRVDEVPTTDRDISVYPNPADGNVWISSSDDLGEVTIEVYDMLGTVRSVMPAQMNKENPIELLLPDVDGVYNIVLKSSAGMNSLRVVRQR